jgi:hypothetical protein
MNEDEQRVACGALYRIDVAQSPANWAVSLTFGDGETFKFDPSVYLATFAVLEWIHRLGPKFYGHAYKQKSDDELRYFCAAPERWNTVGNPVPLHYHLAMDIPENAVAWFEENACRLWHRTALQIFKQHGGHADLQPIHDRYGWARYMTKHSDLDWTLGATLHKCNLADYRRLRAK